MMSNLQRTLILKLRSASSSYGLRLNLCNGKFSVQIKTTF
jgi:hypothetical protein